MTFYYSYYGGKSKEYKHIINYIKKAFEPAGDHQRCFEMVEPFAGSCATSLKVYADYGQRIKYHMNDADPVLTEILGHVKEHGTSKALFEYSNEKNKTITRDIYMAGRTAAMEHKATIYEQFYYEKNYELRKWAWAGGERIRGKVFNHSKYLKTDEFFIQAEISNKDFTEILTQYHDNPRALLYLDPPYLDSANSLYVGYGRPQGGEIPDKTGMYVELIKFFTTCKCAFILVMNYNRLNAYLYAPWIAGTYAKEYASHREGEKRRTRHMIISNLT